MTTRLECGDQGNNPRYVETNMAGQPKALHDELHSQRGEAENRIKEAHRSTRYASSCFKGHAIRPYSATP